MKKNIVRLSIVYVIITLVFSSMMIHTTTIPFAGNEKVYFISAIGIIAVMSLFYSFSLLMFAVAEVCGNAERAIQESKNNWE